MKTLKLSGNMRVIDFDPQTGQSDVDDSRDARIAELEAALRDMLQAYAPKADKTVETYGEAALHSAVVRARRALNNHSHLEKGRD